MKKFRIEIKWALIFTAAILIWMVAERLLGLHDEHIAEHAFYTNFFAIVAISIYLLALYDKRKSYYHGFMSWKQGFISGLILTLIIAILTPLTQLVISLWIAPDYFGNMIEYAVRTGESSRQEAEAYFSLGNYIVQSTVFAAISGIVTAAIAALIMKRRDRSIPSKSADLTGI
ncbi:MAG: DUF4199 domain-containing protein [Salinimicrobium sp.]